MHWKWLIVLLIVTLPLLLLDWVPTLTILGAPDSNQHYLSRHLRRYFNFYLSPDVDYFDHLSIITCNIRYALRIHAPGHATYCYSSPGTLFKFLCEQLIRLAVIVHCRWCDPLFDASQICDIVHKIWTHETVNANASGLEIISICGWPSDNCDHIWYIVLSREYRICSNWITKLFRSQLCS